MLIQFGTDGWRDIIADGFTRENLERVATAHALYLNDIGASKIVIGFDTRFQGHWFAECVARVMTDRGIEVLLAPSYVPTPALSFAVRHFEADGGGVMITASHNPAPYSGYKIKGPYGGSASPEMVRAVEAKLNDTVPPRKATAAQIRPLDIQNAYFAQISKLLDLDVLRGFSGTMYYDAMGGAGAGWIQAYIQKMGLPVDFHPLHDSPNPLFFGVAPEPIAQNLASLIEALKGLPDLAFGTATDGDADRVGAATPMGFFNSHKIFALLLAHLYRKGLRGRVVKTVSTSGIVDALCHKWGLEVVETPVGFKYIIEAFLEGERDPSKAVLFGGEESGGMAVMGHVPERDGILNSLLLLESVATTQKSLDAQFAELEEIAQFKHHYDRFDLHLSSSFDKDAFLKQIRTLGRVAGLTVQSVNDKDGIKLVLDQHAFVMVRASGTEPLLRIYAEAGEPEKPGELIAAVKSLVSSLPEGAHV